MAIERTFSIIKPNACEKNVVGAIFKMIEEAGLKIIATKKIHMTKAQAEGFYAVHAERPFFGSLTDFMCSGPCVVSILEGEDAIKRYRELMGATNPADAAEGTIRKLYADDIEANACHGSDAPDTAAFEMNYFFNAFEIVG